MDATGLWRVERREGDLILGFRVLGLGNGVMIWNGLDWIVWDGWIFVEAWIKQWR